MGKPTVMETRKDDRTFGWLGVKCAKCAGRGLEIDAWSDRQGCSGCGGTGEAYGEIKPAVALATKS